MQKLIPLVYYPLKVLILDDDSDMLQSIQKVLEHKFRIHITTSADEAISLIKNNAIDTQTLLQDITDKAAIDILEDNHEVSTLQFTINTIVNITNDKNKYDKYGILITDYDMPNMDGIALCEEFSTSSLKKILLTGKYDQTDAIVALNNNHIDCYIRKGEETTMEEIEFYAKLFSYKYFSDLSNQILNNISTNKLGFIKDPQFINLFNSLVNKLDIEEYYLISKYGSYLLIDKKNNKYAFISYTQQDIADICDMYDKESDIQNYIGKIRNGKHIPFFGINAEPVALSNSYWEKCLYKATKTDKYYWALIPQN